MEIGLHNATLAIFVAVEVLDETAISVPAAVYSLFMFAFGVTWGGRGSRATSWEADALPTELRPRGLHASRSWRSRTQ